MESGSVLSEPLTLSAHRGYPTDRSASMTIISSSSRSLSGQPRMSQLENLEAKMANIEVSLSSSNLGRRRKGTSIGGSVGGGVGGGGTISARSSPRPESKELRSALQDREAVIQNLRIQLCLGKLPRPTGPPLDESEKPAAEQKLLRLKTDAENKRIAIRNLKSALDKLDITDNIDVRIRQAELEYALGREELQLLSIVEEARALQARLDKSKPESNSLYSILSSGVNLSLHAVQATVGRWAAHQKPDCPGLYVEWALDGEGLFRGDRILEVNGKIGNYRTREELQKNIGSAGKCQLVVVRKKTTSIPHQQLLQQQEDNLRLQHRISYLEEQVRELQTSKESPCSSLHNGTSGHVTSINISSPQLTPPDKPQIFQRGNFVTTLVGGKPIELSGNSQKSHITKTIIKENGSLTDTENNNYMLPVTKSLSASKISISSEQPLLNYCYRRDRERRERQVERNLIRAHSKLSDGNYQHIHSHNNHRNYNHARSVEHLNYSGERKKNCDTICSSVPLSYDQQTRKMNGNDLRSVRSLDFDSDINENNNKKRNIDYTSEPVTPRIRPTPPKKPLRLSLQRAQSLQTVELPSSIVDIDKKRCLKRTHNSDKPPDLPLIQLHTLDNNGSINNNSNHIINNSNSNSNNCNSNSSVVPLHTASLGRQKHI